MTRARGQFPTPLQDRPVDGVVTLEQSGLAFAFEIYGKPAPEGSKVQGFGHSVKASNEVTLKPWRQKVTRVCQRDDQWRPLAGALRGVLLFCFDPPKSWDGLPPSTKTTYDTDKLVRAVGDSLSDADVWEDDARVSVWHLEKAYVGQSYPLDLADEGMVLMSEPGVSGIVRVRSPQIGA